MLLYARDDGRHGQGHRALRDGRPHREARGGAPSHISSPNQGAGKMTTYSLSTPKIAVSRSNILYTAAILWSAIAATVDSPPVSRQPLYPAATAAPTPSSNSPQRTLLAHRPSATTLSPCPP